MRQSLIFSFIVLLCALSQPKVSHSQTLEEEIRAKQKQLMESASIASSKEAQIAKKKAVNKVNALEQSVAASTTANKTIEDPSKQILGYYRGNEGIPLPDPKVLSQNTASPVLTRPMITSAVTKQISTQPQIKREIARCLENGSSRVETGLSAEVPQPVYDVLYLPPDLVPAETEEVFGSKTRVRIVDNPASPLIAFHLTEDSIPCVPFRIRVFDSIKIYDKGRNALKNYDRNPRGQGEFHPWVKEKLF